MNYETERVLKLLETRSETILLDRVQELERCYNDLKEKAPKSFTEEIEQSKAIVSALFAEARAEIVKLTKHLHEPWEENPDSNN